MSGISVKSFREELGCGQRVSAKAELYSFWLAFVLGFQNKIQAAAAARRTNKAEVFVKAERRDTAVCVSLVAWWCM